MAMRSVIQDGARSASMPRYFVRGLLEAASAFSTLET